VERGSRLQPLARAVLRTQSDHRLVGLAREGREAAFEEIVRRYRPGLVAFAAAYAPRDAAEDVVQEGFTAAWQALQDSHREIHLKPWLYTIVRNRALNARRDARVHEPLGEEIDGVPQPDELVLTNDELARAVAAVNDLPESQRRALVRSALDGRTHEQIAAEVGSTPGAVSQLVFRARATARAALGLAIPLPLVRLLLEPAGPAAAGATGAGAAAAAGGGSLLAKGAVVAVIGVAAAGSGVAIRHATRSDAKDEPAATRSQGFGSPASSDAGGTTTTTTTSGALESGDDHGGRSGPGDDSDGGSNSGPGGGSASSSSGPSASSGTGDDSGSSSSGPGSESGSSGSGSGELELDDDGGGGSSSGPGGGSSGSGGSSGPG
jgi:RNA polymerase sigma factor (sigma-70 family)